MAGPVWLNGRIASSDEPLLRVGDRGFQLGDGVFETLRARRAVPIEFDEHLARLRESAAATALPVPLSDGGFAAAIGEVLRAAGLAAVGSGGRGPGNEPPAEGAPVDETPGDAA